MNSVPEIAPKNITSGGLALVVGPSGAGKDSILRFARRRLVDDPRFVFARRLITRSEYDPSEDYEACSEAAFVAAQAAGELILSWRAHGTAYGIRIAILDELAHGRVVIANVSRSVIPAGAALARDVIVAHVTAAPAVLAARLQARGRDTPTEILARLAREAPLPPHTGQLVVINNDGALVEGGEALVTALKDLAGAAARGAAQA
jgi:ribose 1,5-bisphosphokinase